MTAADPPLDRQFLSFVQKQALVMRSKDQLPESLHSWRVERRQLRSQLISSWGGLPRSQGAPKAKVVGRLKRDGYRVEKILLETRPGIWMTANAYVPDGEGRRAAVLCVHGHWQLAKQEPVVQSRCIGLAKLGFFVLMVDAMGAGERGIGRALGEYHGAMVAATLWPTGLALAGLQVYENMRAVDYLQSRPEVRGDRIGITGASGGGNQTMYAGAIDERLKCVVPVCSVGTYQAYLGAACCMCEVTPSALQYAEESRVLALVAPRALMLINATRDAFQFSVGEARKSLKAARHVFRLYGRETNARQAVFESKHDYNQSMRETMYGWMTLHLKGEGDGSPIAEPQLTPEPPEALRCFPGESRPANYVTLPEFAAAEARRLLQRRPVPDHVQQWQTEELTMRQALPRVLGQFPKPSPLEMGVKKTPGGQSLEFSPEKGLRVYVDRRNASGRRGGLALLLDLELGRQAASTPLAEALTKGGWDLVTADLRATGATANRADKIKRAPDHNSAEWSMWIGRPLLGQWVWDVRRMLDALARQGGLPAATTIIGRGPASLIALCVAALDRRVNRVACVGGLASFVSDHPYEQQRLGIMAPGILRDVGDVSHLASLAAPKRLVIAAPVDAAGKTLSSPRAQRNFAFTEAAYRFAGKPQSLRLLGKTDPRQIVNALS